MNLKCDEVKSSPHFYIDYIIYKKLFFVLKGKAEFVNFISDFVVRLLT